MKIRRWILLDLWVLSLAAVSRFGGAVSYGFFWGITLLPVVSLLYLAAVYLQLKLFQQAEHTNIVCGQAVPYLFMIKNESLTPFAGVSVVMFSSFSTVEEMPEGREYELLPKEQWVFETKLTCKYRGEYEIGVKEIVMTDFLRLFRVSYRIPHAVKARVLPRVTRVSGLKGVDDLAALVQRESLRDPVEPDVVVRDYAAGDAVKQIHWKATAREQKLKVRTRTGEEKQGIALVWDTERYSGDMGKYLPLEDKLLEVVVALGVFLAEQNIIFSAHCGQKGVEDSVVRGIVDFDGFYRRVSEVVFDREERFMDVLAQLKERGTLMERRVVFCVLHEIDEQILQITEERGMAGTLTVFYVVTDENVERYTRRSTARCRIIAVPVEAALEGTI